jgi:hypothetical protein
VPSRATRSECHRCRNSSSCARSPGWDARIRMRRRVADAPALMKETAVLADQTRELRRARSHAAADSYGRVSVAISKIVLDRARISSHPAATPVSTLVAATPGERQPGALASHPRIGRQQAHRRVRSPRKVGPPLRRSRRRNGRRRWDAHLWRRAGLTSSASPRPRFVLVQVRAEPSSPLHTRCPHRQLRALRGSAGCVQRGAVVR